MDKEYNLVGVNGNAYAVMGYVTNAMKETDFSKEERDAYIAEATFGDYNNLLCVSVAIVDKYNDILRNKR